jgi:hypothetical protein
LRHVHRHRFIRADDLHRLLDHRSRDRLSRRLMLLFRAGYLDRPEAQIDRYHEGGSRSLVYGLGAKGARVCQPARNRDPLSAPKRDPLIAVVERRGAEPLRSAA